MGLASLLALGALQGCSDDDDPAPAGGSGSGGSAGSGGGSSGSGGSSAGSGGGGGDDLYCGTKESELPSISSCDDADASDCAKAMCATTKAKDCKQILTDCVNDPGCNKAVACGAVCREKDPSADVVATCTPLAGGGLAKALAYKSCADGLKACGGNDSIQPD